jgi:hypothetical protein
MGTCPHCGFEGEASVEELAAHDGDDEQFYRGQLVCPDCDVILGGLQSYGMRADADGAFF